MYFLGNNAFHNYRIPPADEWTAQRFNTKIIVRLWKYVVSRQRDWDIYVQLLTYGHTAQEHLSMNLTQFRLDWSRQPHGPKTVNAPMAILTTATTTKIFARIATRLLHRPVTIQEVADKLIKRRNGAEKEIMMRGFAGRHSRYTPDSICKSTAHQWQPMPQSDWRPSRTVKYCLLDTLPNTEKIDSARISNTVKITAQH